MLLQVNDYFHFMKVYVCASQSDRDLISIKKLLKFCVDEDF